MKKRIAVLSLLAVMAVGLIACVDVEIEEADYSEAEEIVEVDEGESTPTQDDVEEDAVSDEISDTEVEASYTATEEADLEGVEYVHYEFRNQSLLDQHYEKHGIEMNYESAEAYEEGACAVINDPDALYKEEEEDGDGVYYLVDTNEFVILSTDGYIRTYFEPSAGKAYFDRQ